MKKFSHMGQELTNTNDTIDKLSNNVLSIYIEYGIPLNESLFIFKFLDEIKLNIFLCEYDLQRFNIYPYKMTELSGLIFGIF